MADFIKNIGQQKRPEDQSSRAVHKFGGSSLSTAERVDNVCQIISEFSASNDFIVVSANGKITDYLVQYLQAERSAISKIEQFYVALVEESLTNPTQIIEQFLGELSQISCGKLSEDEVLAYGEVWSARLLAAKLTEQNKSALFIDARELLICDSIDSHESFCQSSFELGLKRLTYGNFTKRLVITGFIAALKNGTTLTLGRNGSDFTAALVAKFSKAESVTLWTDVAGVFTADPRLCRQAKAISELSYVEANALAALGTNVLHQKTIAPLVRFQIPLYVRSSIQPNATGTRIGHGNSKQLESASSGPKSIALKADLFEIDITLDLNDNSSEIVDSLFENHVTSIIKEYAYYRKSMTLFISKSDKEKALSVIDSKGLSYLIRKKSQNLIAIIGENVQIDRHLSQVLNERLPSAEIFNHRENDATLLIQTDSSHSENILLNVFDSCFKQSLSLAAKPIEQFESVLGAGI